MLKIVAVLTTLTGQQVGEYPVPVEPTPTLMECQRKIATAEVTDRRRLIGDDISVILSATAAGRRECR